MAAIPSANTSAVPRPRRSPNLSSRLTAGSRAKDKKSDTSSMMTSGRSEVTTPRRYHRAAMPTISVTTARFTQAGGLSASISGSSTGSASYRRRVVGGPVRPYRPAGSPSGMAPPAGCGWSGSAVSLSVRVPEGPVAWNRSPWRPRLLRVGEPHGTTELSLRQVS